MHNYRMKRSCDQARDPKGRIAGTVALASAGAAAIAAACCVLPMALMLVGLGGAWLAIFGRIAAIGFHLGALAVVLIVAAWIVALPRRSGRSTIVALSAGSALTLVAWVVLLNEAAINDYLISLM